MGSSCQDLSDAILPRISAQRDRLKLMRVVHESLGNEIQAASDIRFDRREALNLVRQVRADTLPLIDVPENKGISNVRYLINIDACVPPATIEMLNLTQLFSVSGLPSKPGSENSLR